MIRKCELQEKCNLMHMPFILSSRFYYRKETSSSSVHSIQRSSFHKNIGSKNSKVDEWEMITFYRLKICNHTRTSKLQNKNLRCKICTLSWPTVIWKLFIFKPSFIHPLDIMWRYIFIVPYLIGTVLNKIILIDGN